MPICSRWSTGFDASSSNCPNCGTVWNANAKSRSNRTIWRKMTTYSLIVGMIVSFLSFIANFFVGWYFIFNNNVFQGFLIIFIGMPLSFAQLTVFYFVLQKLDS